MTAPGRDAADRGVVQRRVAGVFLSVSFRREDLRRQIPELAAFPGGVQRGLPRGVARGQRGQGERLRGSSFRVPVRIAACRSRGSSTPKGSARRGDANKSNP